MIFVQNNSLVMIFDIYKDLAATFKKAKDSRVTGSELNKAISKSPQLKDAQYSNFTV